MDILPVADADRSPAGSDRGIVSDRHDHHTVAGRRVLAEERRRRIAGCSLEEAIGSSRLEEEEGRSRSFGEGEEGSRPGGKKTGS